MSKKACFNLGLILTCLMSCAGFASELNLLPAQVTITNRMGQSQTHELTLSLGANAAGVCSGSFVTAANRSGGVAKLASGGIKTVVTSVAAKGRMGMEAWLSTNDSIGAYGTVTGWPMRRRA